MHNLYSTLLYSTMQGELHLVIQVLRHVLLYQCTLTHLGHVVCTVYRCSTIL